MCATVQPGLNYHLPYPIETVLLPKALRVSTIIIGMTLIDDPARRGRTMRDVPEESLMLTGDENIVDVDFTVLWRIKPDGVGDYLFNIQNPEGTVKAVAESAMREVIGRSNIQPILTGARTTTEAGRAGTDAEDARRLRFGRPGRSRCRCRRSIRRRRSSTRSATCRRHAPISSGCRTRRRPIPTASFPTRAAAPRRSCRSPKATSEQAVAEAKGQSSRFLKVYDEYKKAPDVTRAAHLSGDDGAYSRQCREARSMTAAVRRPDRGVVPYLPLSELTPRRPAAAPRRQPQQRGGTR